MLKIERLRPRIEVGLVHRPACTNNPCTCLDGFPREIVYVLKMAFEQARKMLNDHELLARVEKQYREGILSANDGVEWYYDPDIRGRG